MPNFNYNNAIPASNNNPSVDQPGMLINAQSIDGIIATEHISFNANNGGTHKQITFVGPQADPALAPAQSQIYPKSFGSAANYLETYAAISPSAGAQINGYLPLVKAMCSFTAVSVAVGGSANIVPNSTNTLLVNVNNPIVSTRPVNAQNILTITFTNPLFYNTYYVFVSPDSSANTYAITRNTNSLVLTSGFPWVPQLFQIMVI